MIEFCDGQFSAERDKYQWILTEHYDGKDKNGKPKTQSRESYYSNLAQVCAAVIDKKAGECTSMDELITLLKEAKYMLTKAAGE